MVKQMRYDFDNYLAEIPEKSLKHDAVIATNSNDISGFLSMGVADMSFKPPIEVLTTLENEIKRPSSVQVKFTDISGISKESYFKGLWATCIQHEIDHLNGKLFIDYLGPIKRSFITKKMKKYKKEIINK